MVYTELISHITSAQNIVLSISSVVSTKLKSYSERILKRITTRKTPTINGKVPELPNRVIKMRYEGDNFHHDTKPAVEYTNGDKYWYRKGDVHRENGPAIELANGDKWWVIEGEIHRTGGPAIEYADGRKLWVENGIFIKQN